MIIICVQHSHEVMLPVHAQWLVCDTLNRPQVLELERLPSVVTLIGGGYIGMEFAGMFARLGCEVHVVARQALPLAPRFDEEVRPYMVR